MTSIRKPLLVGELNPFGGDDTYALYPLPPECSGGRLQRFFELSRTEYMRNFDRANLCQGRWSLPAARQKAAALLVDDRPAFVLCGSKVSQAFGVEFKPFTVDKSRGFTAVILPHPSGLNRIWNEADAPKRAQATLRSADIDLSPSICQASRGDGECNYAHCQQLRDDEPAKTERSCPAWRVEDDEED